MPRVVRRTLVPDLVLDNHGARSGLGVTVEDGRIVEVGPATQGERLSGRALLPGFANDHSHAFQRALRGAVERMDPSRPKDDFWTWRDRMYALAERLTPGSMREVGRRCYGEMLSAGYTSVTEFHYVHHERDGTPYDDPNALAKSVAEAAEDAGIRLLLLPGAYARGGVPRFRDPSVAAFVERVDALRGWADSRPLLEVGAAAHSVRAVPRGWLEEIGEYARARELPLHVHADEQPREIEECLAEHGCRPIELLARNGCLGPLTTVVHATHADGAELDLLAESDSTICACPTTEADLADGFLPASRIDHRGISLCIGSDSNVRIDPLEELRELEGIARRQTGRRGVFGTERLLCFGADEGARSLGLESWPELEIDLEHISLAGVDRSDVFDALVAGCGADVVRGPAT